MKRRSRHHPFDPGLHVEMSAPNVGRLFRARYIRGCDVFYSAPDHIDPINAAAEALQQADDDRIVRERLFPFPAPSGNQTFL